MDYNEDPNKVHVQVPIEMVFTEDYQETGGVVENWTQAWFQHNRRWSNLPIGRLWPHQQLYRFFAAAVRTMQPGISPGIATSSICVE